MQQRRMFELREAVFCHELGWVKSHRDCMERDEFDEAAVHIVVADEWANVKASVRLLPGNRPWMLDTVFRDLLPNMNIAKESNAMEASRLAVAKDSRSVRLKNGRLLCELLYKAAYVYGMLHDCRYLYMVTSTAVHRHLNRAGVPCVSLGTPKSMADGVRALSAKLDWYKIAENAELFEWYESGLRANVTDGGYRKAMSSGVYWAEEHARRMTS
jgi:N-acyl-L-homoserine lactone synthetase